MLKKLERPMQIKIKSNEKVLQLVPAELLAYHSALIEEARQMQVYIGAVFKNGDKQAKGYCEKRAEELKKAMQTNNKIILWLSKI